MVTAAGPPWMPADLHDDEIVVSQWLAEDLRVKPGDEIALSYFLPESGAKLTEATNTFRVRSIVPMEMPWADRTLMPDFPGLEKAESTRDWDAGFPLTYKIRQQDEDYWKQHRGTPKAFITLAAGQKMWGNRFGNLTAIRFPIPTNAPNPLTPALSPSAGERENYSQSQSKPKAADSSTTSEKTSGEQRLSPLPGGEGQGEGECQTNFVENYRAALEKKILANLKPEELGLRFEPVREQALKAAEQSQDFGGLFLGFSFFVIGAALLLMGLLFSLGLEQRAPEIGTLLALGFTPRQVRKLLLREGVALAFIGGVIGAMGGIYYAKGMLHGLATIWRDAVSATTLNFHVTGQTLVIGIFASVVVSVVTIWLTLRKFVRRPARELLAGETQDAKGKGRSRGSLIGAAALVCAVGTVGWTLWSGETNNAESFFSAGSLVLVAGVAFVSAWLTRWAVGTKADRLVGQDTQQRIPAEFSIGSLAVRGCARRRKRSLSTVAMLACGSFLIVSIGVFRLDANRDATKPSSGTGGFALIGETTMPVVQDLNSQSGRDFFALNENDVKGVSFVPFRVHEGDEASCLNLNAAQRPRLLGVRPGRLGDRFTFAKLMPDTFVKLDAWSLLSKTSVPDRAPVGRDEIPAIGDANSIQWAMHKKVGDTLDYVDERGQPFKVRIVGAVANSILQGQLIIDEAEFVKRFPGESGYRMFLVDAPSNVVSQVSATLSRAMQDVGLELTPAAQRLAQFNAVQNTYLGTFQVLGGLGLLLGSVGLGIVVLRNVLERRGELAVLLAVGFRKPQLQRLLLLENGALLATGLMLGVAAAGVAVLPALLSPNSKLPYASLAVTLGAVLVNGALWTWAATRLAVRGDLLRALRNE
jgi:ABC-type antimicrobial peptide transport system permease subunit